MPEIELSGGSYDGKRIQVPEIRDRFLLAPLPPAISVIPPSALLDTPVEPLVYRRAGMRDDGTPWYQLR